MTILTELHQDHINLNKLLVMLQQKVTDIREGEHPNFSLIGEVVSYISGYADGFHHPREDRMYTYFAQRNELLDALLTTCEEDHVSLKSLTEELKETIEGVLHDAVMPMGEFASILEAFVLKQTNHLNFEEGELFPAIDQVANAEDWAVLDKLLPKPADPLFGEQQAHEYTTLYRELIIDLNAA